jgi:hypothetical protein
MPTLLELQVAMLEGVLDGAAQRAAQLIAGGDIDPARRVGIYANNAETNFIDSLRVSFPAVRRLAGDAYFDQCARIYRREHASTSGDLQHAGARFPQFLAALLGAGEYRYFADVAALEWLYQESLLAADHARLDLAKLAAVAPQAYGELRFMLHPTARLLASDYPTLEIWEANAGSEAEPPLIDLSQGPQWLLANRSRGRVRVTRVSAGEHAFLERLRHGANLDEAFAAGAATQAEFDAAATLQKFVAAEAIVDFALPREG